MLVAASIIECYVCKRPRHPRPPLLEHGHDNLVGPPRDGREAPSGPKPESDSATALSRSDASLAARLWQRLAEDPNLNLRSG